MQNGVRTPRMYDLITKKKRGGELTKEELRYFVKGCVTDDIPKEQQAALLMAIWFQGMTDAETAELTVAMTESGETMEQPARAQEQIREPLDKEHGRTKEAKPRRRDQPDVR